MMLNASLCGRYIQIYDSGWAGRVIFIVFFLRKGGESKLDLWKNIFMENIVYTCSMFNDLTTEYFKSFKS